MLDLMIIDKDNIEFFVPMISDSALAYIDISHEIGNENNLLMYGALDDDKPVGVIIGAISPEDYIVEIKYIFVKKEYRRQGIASNLILIMCDAISTWDDNFTIECEVTEFWKYKDESKGNDVEVDAGSDLRGLFKFLEFNEEINEEVGAYQMHMSDGEKREVAPIPDGYYFKKPSELTRTEKDSLRDDQNGMILHYINNGELDDELSRFYVSGEDVKSYLAIKSDDKICSIVWASVKKDSQVPAVYIGRDAFLTAREKRSGDTVVYMPYINDVSKKMIEKICNNKEVQAEINYKYSLELSDTF